MIFLHNCHFAIRCEFSLPKLLRVQFLIRKVASQEMRELIHCLEHLGSILITIAEKKKRKLVYYAEFAITLSGFTLLESRLCKPRSCLSFLLSILEEHDRYKPKVVYFLPLDASHFSLNNAQFLICSQISHQGVVQSSCPAKAMHLIIVNCLVKAVLRQYFNVNTS